MNLRTPVRRPVSLLAGIAYGLLGAALYALPTRFGAFETPMPWLALLPVFFFATSRRGAWPAVIAFALGLFQDLISGGPLGVFAFAFLAGHVIASLSREALDGQSPAAVWIGFAAVAFVAGVASAIAGGVALGGSPALLAILLQILVTIALAPIAARPLGGFVRFGARGRPA